MRNKKTEIKQTADEGKSLRSKITRFFNNSKKNPFSYKELIKKQLHENISNRVSEIKAKAKEKFTQAFNLFKEGEFEAAVIRFNQALEIDPANGLGHYYLAETYARLNDLENAMKHYNYTVLFTPDIKEAAIAEVKILKIKETLNKSSN